MTLSAQFIIEAGKELQEISVEEKRAGELAAEVERLNGAVREAGARLDFDAEPSAFLAILAAHAG